MNSAPTDTSGELPKHYDPHAARELYYNRWEAAGVFHPEPAADDAVDQKPPYCIVIPPPNVTGSLHMGHALNNTLQDVLIRYHRMNGFNALWIPGTDHASIAVHWVLDRKFKEEGTNRFELGREEFLRRAWEFKAAAESNIVGQLRALGVACDWQRQRFTMDEGLSAAVREAFVRLHNDGLIYRAETLVNWDPVAQTTVSDLEVVHEEGVESELWSFAYPLADGSGEIVVATTRPETMLGDTAIAVHPEDERFGHLIGSTVKHPLCDREIPIVGDPILVDPEFGTGAVKVTPAHDFNDFEVGKRHNLEKISIFDKHAIVNANGGDFEGLDRFEARTAIKDKLRELGLERGSQPHTMNIGRSERSGAIVEPLISTQWFVRTKSLAAPSLAAVERGVTKFVPDNWKNTYYAWLRDIREWCISRQLWWGHQIPAWHCEDCSDVTVARDTPDVCEHCGSDKINQDTDVLDTWFSSALWPFSTMGWPQDTPELRTWYPTAVLTTGFDIIFFWVARMMFFGQYFMGQVPFADVYIHALIRDQNGEKMSKTKGNVVDPLKVMDKYGCDAFRFTLAAFAAQGRDVRWDENRAAGYSKFCNKIWQAFRFTMSHLPKNAAGTVEEPTAIAVSRRGVYDRWIIGQLSKATEATRAGVEGYHFNDAAHAIYAFIWDIFCDWYLELCKPVLFGDDLPARDAARRTLYEVFEGVARLFHPLMPFLSEELWQQLPGCEGSVYDAPFPASDDFEVDADATAQMAFVQDVITAIRRARSELGVAPKMAITAWVRTDDIREKWLDQHAVAIDSLARAKIEILSSAASSDASRRACTEVVDGAEIVIPLAGLIDFEAERARLQKEHTKLDKEIGGVQKQLDNPNFVDRAPAEVVQSKREQLARADDKRQRIIVALARLDA